MLDGMRKAAQGGIGRFVMAIVMGLIIVSFVIWGIGDMFRGLVSDKVANVGGAAITAQEFQTEMQNLIYQYQRRAKVPLTNAQAHAMGLDSQVLERLIDDAALDQRTKSMGLAISDATIAQAAFSDPEAAGLLRPVQPRAVRPGPARFRPQRARFFAKQREGYLRQQLEYSLVDGMNAPKPLVEALAAAEAQTRSIDYFTLPASAAGDIPAPAIGALQSYYEDRKSSYRAPEYRAIDYLLVSPATLAKPSEVTDEDAKAVYEKEKDTRFTTPEKRKLQQIVFPTEAEADGSGGEDQGWRELRRHRQGAQADRRRSRPRGSDQGRHLRSRHRRRRLRAARGRRQRCREGPVRLPDPARDRNHADERQGLCRRRRRIKNEIATQRAGNEVQALHDKIEDARVSGKSLVDAAKSVGLEARRSRRSTIPGSIPRAPPSTCPRRPICCARSSPPTSASTTRR